VDGEGEENSEAQAGVGVVCGKGDETL